MCLSISIGAITTTIGVVMSRVTWRSLDAVDHATDIEVYEVEEGWCMAVGQVDDVAAYHSIILSPASALGLAQFLAEEVIPPTSERCPCEFPEIEACSSNCSCAHPVMSAGCARCCTYGSRDQRLAAARHLVPATPWVYGDPYAP